MKNMKEIIDNLKRLSSLFADPQEGLSTWHSMVNERMTKLRDYYFNPEKRVSLFRICYRCQKEFKVVITPSVIDGGHIATTERCPHCDKLNEIYVRIVT